MADGPFVRRGDTLRLAAFSSRAIELVGHATALLQDGTFQTINVPDFTTGSGVGLDESRSVSQFRLDGRIIDGLVTGRSLGKRGETYVRLETRRSQIEGLICSGYAYGVRIVSMPMVEGSREGPGHRFNRALADDVTPIDIQHTLGLVNRLRRIDGFIWYYHCSADVADRTLRASFRDMGDGLPTGMTSGVNTTSKLYPSAGVLTVSANQEGLIYVNANTGKSFATSLDNGAATIEDITTDPDPFPYWAQEDDVGEIFFDVQLAEAADRHSIYLIEEEWVDV